MSFIQGDTKRNKTSKNVKFYIQGDTKRNKTRKNVKKKIFASLTSACVRSFPRASVILVALHKSDVLFKIRSKLAAERRRGIGRQEQYFQQTGLRHT